MCFGSKRLDKVAKRGYVLDMCQALDNEPLREESRLKKGSVSIYVKDPAKFKTRRTFAIHWDTSPGALPKALERDRIVVYLVEPKDDAKKTKKRKIVVAKGFISSIEQQRMEIILDGKPIFDDKKAEQKDREWAFEIRPDLARIRKEAYKLWWTVTGLASSNLSPHIWNCLLNSYEERTNTKFMTTRVLKLADSPKLTKEQGQAVEQSLMKRISLIEGVEGSGKTLVAVNVAFSMNRIHRERRKVLLCSPIQATVNRLAKIVSSDYEISVVQLTPDKIIDWRDKSFRAILGVKKRVDDECRDRWIKRLQMHKIEPTKRAPFVSPFRTRKTEQALLRGADIVCCTLKQSIDERLRGIDFKTLVIDDAQYATEIECLLAMRFKSIKQVTLIGDMRRGENLFSHSMRSNWSKSNDRNRYDCRSSFIADNRMRLSSASPNELQQHDNMVSGEKVGSLFDRWLACGLPSVVLKLRHRKINKLNQLLRQYFYQYDGLAVDRKLSTGSPKQNEEFTWPPRTPIMFDVHQASHEDITEKLLTDLEKREEDASVCIITNLDPSTRITAGYKLNIDIGCVNDFLGQQRDFVILKCDKASQTRTTRKSRVDNDFSRHDEALMIALTRACRGLFIITDLRDYETGDEAQPFGTGWESLIQYFREENLIHNEYRELSSASSTSSPSQIEA